MIRKANQSKALKLCFAALLLPACAVVSSAQTLLTGVTTGSYPIAVAVNAATNKIYVVNQNSDSVTVIDGVTYNTVTVPTGARPMLSR